jgi:predicted O-methyltransferase YrrM
VTPEELYADRPLLHRDGARSGRVDWALSTETLRLLQDAVTPGAVTLETGAGLSTVLLALLGARHTAITAEPADVELITEYCGRHRIGLDDVRLVVGRSQEVLPGLRSEPLDLVLLDGSHAFPVPFLDWYFTAGRLRVGGLLVIDDTQLWTGGVLRDFLAADPGWQMVAELERTTAVRKIADVDLDPSWVHQPYVTARSLLHDGTRWRPYGGAAG